MNPWHLLIWLLAFVAGVDPAACGVAAGAYLNASQIRGIAPCRFTGHYYEQEKTVRLGEEIAGQMTVGGTFFMVWNGGRWPTGKFDKARWWTQGETWCRQFNDLSNGRPICYSVRRDGLEFAFLDAHGAKAFDILCDALTS